MGLVGSQAAAAGSAPPSATTRASTTDTRGWCLIVGPPCPKGVPTKHSGVRRRSAPDPAAGQPTSPSALGCGLLQRCLGGVHPPERHDAGHFPLVPRLVDLGLEVRQVLLGEVGEPALLQEVLADRLAGAALDDRLRLAVVAELAVLDLVEREDAGLDGQLAELVAQHRIVVPALRARIERVDE